VFTRHDFRRLLATELVDSGLPIHIGAALLGHLNVQTGYVAVFGEDVVRHYEEFLHRCGAQRPWKEYRSVTDTECGRVRVTTRIAAVEDVGDVRQPRRVTPSGSRTRTFPITASGMPTRCEAQMKAITRRVSRS
jgi:hypothetical protein